MRASVGIRVLDACHDLLAAVNLYVYFLLNVCMYAQTARKMGAVVMPNSHRPPVAGYKACSQHTNYTELTQLHDALTSHAGIGWLQRNGDG